MSDLLLQVTNALTLADELAALELKNRGTDPLAAADVELLKRQLEHVLATARRVTGLNPDGTFDKLPLPPRRPHRRVNAGDAHGAPKRGSK